MGLSLPLHFPFPFAFVFYQTVSIFKPISQESIIKPMKPWALIQCLLLILNRPPFMLAYKESIHSQLNTLTIDSNTGYMFTYIPEAFTELITSQMNYTDYTTTIIPFSSLLTDSFECQYQCFFSTRCHFVAWLDYNCYIGNLVLPPTSTYSYSAPNSISIFRGNPKIILE